MHSITNIIQAAFFVAFAIALAAWLPGLIDAIRQDVQELNHPQEETQ